MLLTIVGLSYSHIWPADILHFYGFCIGLVALFLTVNDRILLLTATIPVLAFVLLLLVFDYDEMVSISQPLI